MSHKALGDGSVIDVGFDVDEREQEIEALRHENRRLQRAVSDAKIEADRAREDANRALSMLRRQLSPLFRALQAVFGELDDAGVTEDAPSSGSPTSTVQPATDTRVQAVWTAWKGRLSPAAGKIIDALLIHGELNGQQICVAAGMGKNTLYGAISALNKAGVLVKNGGRYALKQL